MKLLRETIRKLILENTCENLNSQIQKGISELEKRDLHVRSLHTPEEYDSGYADKLEIYVLDAGGFDLAQWTADLPYGLGHEECLQAWTCSGAYTEELKGTGVGALLYDLAIELVGKAGMSAGRDQVSSSAYPMWVYMMNNKQTYDINGTFDWDGEQTPEDPSDDCASTSWESHTNWHDDPSKNPLNQVFVKKDTSRPTIRCLDEKDLIFYGGID